MIHGKMMMMYMKQGKRLRLHPFLVQVYQYVRIAFFILRGVSSVQFGGGMSERE